MPELIAVLPPTQRPCKSGIGTLLLVASVPMSRADCANASTRPSARSSGFRNAPSSIITTS
jgi:hypothetical protein